MSKDVFRRMLDERWFSLEAEEVTGERRLRVATLPVDTDHGPVSVAVDLAGHRHLLVPTRAHGKVRPGLDGPVLRLRKRPLEDADTYQHYADLACLRPDLDDLFTELCADVLVAVDGRPINPVRTLHRILDRWKALFQPHGTPLGSEQLAGLFGELSVLKRLLERDASAHRLWSGPLGHRHDFSAGSHAVEVKSSLVPEGRRARIHGLEQLEVPEDGSLCLAWLRLRRAPTNGPGTAFVDAVNDARRLCDDEAVLLDLLAAAGYHPIDAELYGDVRFLIDEERWYRVESDFPGLTSRELMEAGVPISVLDVEYSIDLSGDVPAAMSDDSVSGVIDAMIQVSS